MKSDRTTSSHELAKREILRLADADGTVLHCVRGSLWLTEDADQLDHVIEAGQQIRLRGRGTALVMALDAASLRVSQPARNSPSLRMPGDLLRRLAFSLGHRMQALGGWA